MSDDDLPEWARGLSNEEILDVFDKAMKQIRERYEKTAVADMEQQLAATPSFSWPPAPMTAHPALERNAESVRGVMRSGAHTVNTIKPRSMASWLLKPEPDLAEYEPPDNIVTLTIRKAWGPAPYVGAPYVIAWPVAVDNLNRWVAGEPVTWPL